ncbi:MAG: polyprenyl synthetase family protein [Thermoplasmata archaeon]
MSSAPWDFGIQKELDMVEKKLHDMVRSQERVLTEASLHVIDAGGKRLRPTVTLLVYKALGGTDTERIVDIATGFELIHSATLVHDDINDGGMTRRGRETVYKKYGLHDAIVTGDFLFVQAFALGGRFDRNVVETTADACAKLAEGEVMQFRYRHRTDLSVDAYLKIMERKTAYPIRAGAMVGAYLAGASPNLIESMGAYGMNLGIAFQIIDDVLDFAGDQSRTGKEGGVDLREGHLTLPSLLAIRDSAAAKELVLRIVSMDCPPPELVRAGVKAVVESGAVSKARSMAEYYGMEAVSHLGALPKTRESQALRDLVKRVLERDS